MKTRLLRKWNCLMAGVYAFDATWNMSFAQRCRYAWFRLTGLDRLGKDAHSEFTSYYAAYHGLGYGIGPGILIWDISRKGMQMHDHARQRMGLVLSEVQAVFEAVEFPGCCPQAGGIGR